MYFHYARQATRLKLPTAAALAVLLLHGCASRGPYGRTSDEPLITGSEAGQVLGGVAGAATGAQVGSGSGQIIATVAGGLIGSIVGERIGARMEDDDRHRTARALDRNEHGETSRWQNGSTEFAVTPEQSWRNDAGQTCREFRFQVETDRGEDVRNRVACRQPDGTWEVTS